MKTPLIPFLLWSALAGVGCTCRAEVIVTMDHRGDASATKAFKFDKVPTPGTTAALAATFKVVDGAPDDNSATVDVLHDGKLPDNEDQPSANFFFHDVSDGGRLLVDLGKTMPIKEVDTYSWHPSTRAPQVYKLYGSDGGWAGVVGEPKRPHDPTQEGWKLIATVDTRTQFEHEGGQYGVKVADKAGLLGNYRYLLFDMSCTEDDNDFGNTFYSEINVVTEDAVAAPTPAPSTTPRADTSSTDQSSFHVHLDYDTADCTEKEMERLEKTFATVYPRMAAEFNHDAPKNVRILMDPNYSGIAQTEGTTIRCNPAWFRDHPEDLDVVVHEGMHVVQQYHHPGPGWITEGIADYARAKYGVNNAASGWTMPEYDPKQSYKDSYRITARFFVWLEKHTKPGIVVALDQTVREGKYTPEFWTQQTGEGVNELWQDYSKNPAL